MSLDYSVHCLLFLVSIHIAGVNVLSVVELSQSGQGYGNLVFVETKEIT